MRGQLILPPGFCPHFRVGGDIHGRRRSNDDSDSYFDFIIVLFRKILVGWEDDSSSNEDSEVFLALQSRPSRVLADGRTDAVMTMPSQNSFFARPLINLAPELRLFNDQRIRRAKKREESVKSPSKTAWSKMPNLASGDQKRRVPLHLYRFR